MNVLVVDDSDIIRRMILKTLDLAGLPLDLTLEASNGREALEVLEDEWIDVVIADLNMPVMDGMELLRTMRDSAAHRSTPVIVVSTEGASTRLAALRDMGVSTFVRKPFTPEQIRDAVSALDAIGAPDEHVSLVGDLAITVLERFAMLFAEPGTGVPAAPAGELFTSVLRFAGVVTGSVTAVAPLGLCAEMAQAALGTTEDATAHDAADALGEFTNMLAGMLGTTVDADLHTELTPPVVSRATAEDWRTAAAQHTTAVLDVEGSPLLVSLRMRREQ